MKIELEGTLEEILEFMEITSKRKEVYVDLNPVVDPWQWDPHTTCNSSNKPV